LVLIGVVAVVVLGGGGDDSTSAAKPTEYATITTTFGDVVVALDSSEAPKSEAQFVGLAKKGFYDGLTFHRAVKDFVIQGGDPKGDGSGGSGTSVPDELPKSSYKIGDLAFANAGSGTSDSQFFIITGKQGAKLPLKYNRFGRVVRGLDIAQQISDLAPASGDGPPTEPVNIVKIVISKKAPPDAPNIASTSTTPST
jgi:peptidyl-prolyl cis-trans isomerase B (cyclophilin B)